MKVVELKLKQPIGLIGLEVVENGKVKYVRLDEVTIKLSVEEGKEYTIRPILVPMEVIDELIRERRVVYGESVKVKAT